MRKTLIISWIDYFEGTLPVNHVLEYIEFILASKPIICFIIDENV